MNIAPKFDPNGPFPIILTDKQEKFCVLIVEGVKAREAYMTAYGQRHAPSADTSASRTLRLAKVQARIAQLKAHEAAALRVSVEFLTKEMLATSSEARAAGNHAAAQQGYMNVAKMHGFLIERHMVDTVVRRPSNDPDSPDEMTAEKWLEEHGLMIGHQNVEDAEVEPIDPAE